MEQREERGRGGWGRMRAGIHNVSSDFLGSIYFGVNSTCVYKAVKNNG